MLPLDITGQAVSNLITAEVQNINSGLQNYCVVIPKQGPFFANSYTPVVTGAGIPQPSIVVSITGTSSTHATTTTWSLTMWKDYIPILPFIEATSGIGLSIYGGILIKDPSIVGTISVTYQSLGGQHQVIQSLADAYTTGFITKPAGDDYASVFNFTNVDYSSSELSFNKIDKNNLGSMRYYVGSVLTAIPSIVASSPLYHTQHIGNYNNPHQDTAAGIGLGNVPNWTIATPQDISAAVARNKFVTPAMAALAAKTSVSVPVGTTTVPGTVTLNSGTLADDNNPSKVLTAAALVSLAQSPNTQIGSFLLKKRKKYVLGTVPVPFPVTFNSYVCYNYADIATALKALTGLNIIQYSQKQGCFWLPYEISTTGISLTVTPYTPPTVTIGTPTGGIV